MIALLSKIDRQKKNKAAKKINNFKRCIFNIEDNVRNVSNSNINREKLFLEFLPKKETIEAFSFYRKLNPEDFENS